MNLTLVYEQLLTDPRYADVIPRLRELAPTAFIDQMDAAATDADRISRSMGALFGADPDEGGYAPTSSFPDWLRLGALDALAQFVTGKATVCRHNPTADRAQPVIAAAWKPGYAVCPQCIFLIGCRPGSLADRTCDGCGHECTGPANNDGIHPSLVRIGAFVYQYGACVTCKDDLPEALLSLDGEAR